MMQTCHMSTAPPLPQDVITTVIIDEVHHRSAHSDYVLALMQNTSDSRLVLMSATGDHKLVRERIPPLSTTCDAGSYAQCEEMLSCAAFGQIGQYVEHHCSDCDYRSQR